MYMNREDYELYARSHSFIVQNRTTVRAALEQRLDYFRDASKEAMAGHRSGALSDPAPEGHIKLIDNAGLFSMAKLCREQAEGAVATLRALNRVVDTDEYDADAYAIDWEEVYK
jgi:hypothetical protein